MSRGAIPWRVSVGVLVVVVVAIAWARFGPARSSAPWEATVDLSVRSDTASSPHVGVDARGSAVAVWTARTREGLLVQSAARAAGGGWRGPVNLSSPADEAETPQVGVGAQGTAVAVWESRRFARTGPRVILSAVREPGERWQAPVRVSAARGAADAPRVAVDGQGTAVAVWTTHRGSSRTRVQSSRRRSGGTWERPVDIATISAASHAGFADPRIAVDEHGNAAAVWTNVTDGGNFGVVQSAVRPAGRGWQAPVDMSRARHRSLVAHVAYDADGDAIVVWADYTDQRARSAMRPADGAWTDPVDIFEGNVLGVGLAVSPGGKRIVAWTKRNGPVTVASLTGAGRWRALDDLVTRGDIRDLTIVVDDDGNAAAVWLRGDGGDTTRAALLVDGERWQATADLSPYAVTGEASGASVEAAMDRRGTVIAVWVRELEQRSDGPVNVVQAAIHRRR